MDYPVWFIPGLSDAFLIALISVTHVFVAHFAVGGGLFLVLTEMKARRENNPVLLNYVKSHTKFFLLLTMVFGGVSGVGIWFIIALSSPAVTSTLIHTFVFAWATEWVFFVGEIAALLIYHYKFDTMRPKDHVFVGWMYFLCAMMSLIIIAGVVDFMLTPGKWLETRDFWDGFFNPTFWPSVFSRSFMSFMFAGMFAFVTAIRIKDATTREAMTRLSALWVAAPFIFWLASCYWYLVALPAGPAAMVLAKSTEIPPLMQGIIWIGPVIVLFCLAYAFLMPNNVRPVMVAVVLALGLSQMGLYEWIREAGRRPYLIFDHTYSNQIKKTELAAVNKDGVMAHSGWFKDDAITDATRLEVGRTLYGLQCVGCHSAGGPLLDILPRTAKFSVFGMDAQLDGQGKVREYMPPFAGNRAERWALATYIVEGLHGKKAAPAAYQPKQHKTDIPPFDADTAEYVLMAWNNLGMHCISDSEPYWVLLPPANDLFAQLIKRGPAPEIVTEGVTLRYEVEKGFENPARHVDFWKHAHSSFGAKDLPENVGLSGNAMSGAMKLSEDLRAFEATLVPVTPYPDEGGFQPYPTFTITAVDDATGKVLATTRMVAPTSTEMGCKNCHGGEWRVDGVAGFTPETSRDVLAVHDRISKTNHLERVAKGETILCQSCHPDPVLGTKGQPGRLNFPAALHGFHANYLSNRGPEACYACHPASAAGPTGCLRGTHAKNLDCTTCHGTLEDHALSLLKKEQEAKNPRADALMANIKPRTVASVADVNPRTPWLMEPDCLSCHDHEARPQPGTVSAFNKWTEGQPGQLYRLRRDDMEAVMCEACHGSTHAVYPATNIYGADRDNIPPLQYQGMAGAMGKNGGCIACHGEEMDASAHHPIPE
ncbi:MAG: cytochrome ubiquinol oxidase subunit I [Desulfovibrionaceae bacterium]